MWTIKLVTYDLTVQALFNIGNICEKSEIFITINQKLFKWNSFINIYFLILKIQSSVVLAINHISSAVQIKYRKQDMNLNLNL